MDVLEHVLLDPSANPACLQLSLLQAITDNFSDACRIGSGGFADVYKGRLRNDMVVAVKKLKMVEIDEKEFMQEVSSLMGVKHKNIVRLLGYCHDTKGEMLDFKGRIVMAEERRRLLCFEFLPKGSLNQHISDASCGLKWHERYDIIKGICFSLHYLHMQSNIAHMDLKPHNILMDDNMVAKIGDFGTSRLIDPNKSMVTKNIIGTRGYMAPEYIENGLVSKKADIFSLGVIILELLTGSRHYDLTEESSMAQYTVEVVGKWMKRLPNAAYSQQVSTCVLIAIECVSSDKDKRPTTESIINKLIKVESEIREKLIKEGQEWVEGITNVIVGVVALVLILRSWVLTIGVAVIVLLRLQNPLSSGPRVVARECVSYDKDKRPITECTINKLIKVESELREKLINEDQESWSWLEGITNVTVVVALVLILRSWVLTIGVAVIVLLCLHNPMSSWPRVVWVILFGIGAVLLTGLILMNPRSWSWVLLILKVPTALLLILVKVAIFVRRQLAIFVKHVFFYRRTETELWDHVEHLLIFLDKGVTAAMARDLLLDRRRLSWMMLLFTLVSNIVAAVLVLILNTRTSWPWVAVERTYMNFLAIPCVFVTYDMHGEDSLWNSLRKSWAWIILSFAIEAVQATVINLVNPIISLSLAATAHSIVRFLVALCGIELTIQAHLSILHRQIQAHSLRKSWAILFAFWSWLMVDVMTPLTLFALGLMVVILLALLWSTSTSESASLLLYPLLYPVAVALVADIVITRGIMGVFAIFISSCCILYIEDQ